MKITLGKYVCGHCRNSFEAPILDETRYGEFLLWSKSGHVAYLNAIEDRVYLEVKSILEDNFTKFKRNPMETAEVTQAIFGPIACDPDPAGQPYKIGALPPCPDHPESPIISWEVIYPPEVADCEIPEASHFKWNVLNSSNKVELIAEWIALHKS
jgi:hypothetical protein